MRKILIILLLFASCKAKHTTTTVTKTDTIYKNRVVTVQPPQLHSLLIDNPCDSLGNLKTFNYVLKGKQAEVVIKTVDNYIELEVNIDSLRQVWEKEYISKSEVKEEVKTVTERYIPKWIWYVLIASLLVNAWFFRKPIINLVKTLL